MCLFKNRKSQIVKKLKVCSSWGFTIILLWACLCTLPRFDSGSCLSMCGLPAAVHGSSVTANVNS